jgi:hypothetical protein
MPPESKIRTDTQAFGKQLILGGTDADAGWGDVGAAVVTLRKDTANTVSPVLTIEAVAVADLVASIGGSVDLLGKLDLSAGQLRVPQGTTLPVSGEEEGDLFWQTDTDTLYIYTGTGWQTLSAIAAVANVTLSGSQNGTSSTGFVEVMKFLANLKSLFPINDFKLQANIWVTGSAAVEVRLYNWTDAVAVTNAVVSTTNDVPTLVEATSASTPLDALKEYTLDIRRVGGLPANNAFIRGAMLRKV